MRVMLFYRSLTVGGTERQIAALAKGLAQRGHDVSIVTFYDLNPLGEGLAGSGVELASLHKTGRWEIVGFLWRFWAEVRRWRPDVLYAFLPMTNLVALTARLAAPRLPVVWGVRTANLDLGNYDWLNRLSYWAEGKGARFARLVLVNSHVGADDLARRGFPADRVRMVPNGIDVDRFRPERDAGLRVRAAWGVGAGVKLVGTVARLSPVKGIPLFLEAAALILRTDNRSRFVVVGDGEPSYREELQRTAERLGLGARLIWAGARDDMPEIYSALDLMVLSSPNEGTSNAVLEAMACGISVVATDVGDNDRIIGNRGRTVLNGDPAALADAIRLQLDRRAAEGEALAEVCRRHVVAQYAMAAMVERTESLLQEAIAGPS